MDRNLMRLERIDLREVWKHEACDFTPWLARDENLQMLGEELGLFELELIATEHLMGSLKVDILCLDNAGKVIIENQLENSDYAHLGRIITYAAVAGAKKVIWLAKSFRAEHVQALEFLNRNTISGLNFFAVEVKIYGSFNSTFRPSFDAVVKPSGWSKVDPKPACASAIDRPPKQSKASQEWALATTINDPIKQMQLRFWTTLAEYVDTLKTQVRTPRPQAQQWVNSYFGLWGSYVKLSVNARDHCIAAQVFITRPIPKQTCQILHLERRIIEDELGFLVEWNETPSGSTNIGIFWRGTDIDVTDELAWPVYCEWFADKLIRLTATFKPRLRALLSK